MFKLIPTGKYRNLHFLLSVCVSLALSYISALIQSQFPTFNHWIFIYLTVFLVAWFGGMFQGMLTTIASLGLGLYFIVGPEKIVWSDIFELVFLSCLGFWVSYLMQSYKQSQQKLSASEELNKSRGFLDTLLENLPLMVFVKDAEDLRFVRFNKAGLDLLGLDKSDLIGKNDYDHFPKDQADAFTLKDREVLSQGGTLDIPYEPIQTRFKGERILHTKKIPILSAEGRPLYLLGVSEDITDKLLIEEQRLKILEENATRNERLRMQERENYVANAISSLSQTLDYQEALQLLAKLVVPAIGDWSVLTVKDDSGQFVRAMGYHQNPEFRLLLDSFIQKFPPDSYDVELKKVLEFGESSLIPEITEKSLESLVTDPGKVDIYRKIGTTSSLIVPVKCREKIHGALGIVRGNGRANFDALDLAMAEEIGRRAGIVLENSLLFKSMKLAVRARDEFLSIASHELKTPITSLKMQLQMLERSNKGEEKIIKPVANAIKQIDRLTMLVNDLLNVSKIESGKMSYHFQTMSLAQVINEVAENVKNQFVIAKVELIVNVMCDAIVMIDRYRFEQVLINLLNNALKYGENKPVEIFLKQENDFAVVTVKDSGKGIPAEFHDKIFDKFERALQDYNISGLGLGLFISKQIVEAHKGGIEILSSPGKGSEFKVRLPLVQQEQ